MEDELMKDKEVIKLEKKLGADFANELRAMDKEQLEAKLLALAKYRQEIQSSKNADEELKRAKQRKADLEAPYRDSMKDNDLRSRLVSLVMEEKGYE